MRYKIVKYALNFVRIICNQNIIKYTMNYPIISTLSSNEKVAYYNKILKSIE